VTDDVYEERPDHLDSTYRAFHGAGRSVAWWPRGGFWFVAGHEEVSQAAKDSETFSSRHDIPNGSSPYLGVMVPPTPIAANPIELDPPDHAVRRRAVNRRLLPRGLAALTPDVQRYVTWCIDRRISGGKIDLFHDLAKLVPAMVTFRLLGLPLEYAGQVADAVHIRGEDRFALSPVWTQTVEQIIEAMIERRREPADDLISDLVTVQPDGSRVPEKKVLAICLTMIIGGMSTTAKGALGSLWHFGCSAADRQRLIDDPEAIGPAVEEMLRYFSPVPLLARTATRDTTLGPAQIAEGDRVVIGYGAANRDPAVFDDPNEVDIARSPNPHVAMGHGGHFCVGAALGRMELAMIITEVLRRMPDYELQADREFLRRLTVRPQSLPATFTPGEPEGDPDAIILAQPQPEPAGAQARG
jgi:cytochrome P450